MANRHAKGRLMGGSLFRETLRTDPLEKANEESGLEWGTRQSQDTPPYLPAKAAVKGGTTTPWTLPGNVALAVSPTATYARVRVGDDDFLCSRRRV